MSKLIKDENLKYELETLVSYNEFDPDFPSEFEVLYEDALGGEHWLDVNISKLAQRALNRIRELEVELAR